MTNIVYYNFKRRRPMYKLEAEAMLDKMAKEAERLRIAERERIDSFNRIMGISPLKAFEISMSPYTA